VWVGFWSPTSSSCEKSRKKDFDKILTAAGVPDTPIPEAVLKKWSNGPRSSLLNSAMLLTRNTKGIFLKDKQQLMEIESLAT